MKDPLDIQAGATLAETRRGLMMSRRELGRISGIAHQQIARWETGERSMRVRDLYTLSVAMGLPVSAIIPDSITAP